MTNKRKSRVRALQQKTGMSYQAASNALSAGLPEMRAEIRFQPTPGADWVVTTALVRGGDNALESLVQAVSNEMRAAGTQIHRHRGLPSKSPLDCFLLEEFGPEHDAVYQKDHDSPALLTQDGCVMKVVSGETVRISPSGQMTDELAWSILLEAAQADVSLRMCDLTPWGIVSRDGVTLMVAEPEFLGRRVRRGPQEALFLHNFRAVVRIDPETPSSPVSPEPPLRLHEQFIVDHVDEWMSRPPGQFKRCDCPQTLQLGVLVNGSAYTLGLSRIRVHPQLQKFAQWVISLPRD